MSLLSAGLFGYRLADTSVHLVLTTFACAARYNEYTNHLQLVLNTDDRHVHTLIRCSGLRTQISLVGPTPRDAVVLL